MERLRLTSKEKENLIKCFTAEVENTHRISDLDNFSTKTLINKLDEKNIIKPTILINSDVMHKMWALVEQSNVEISWHGFVKRDAEKQLYYIYDIAVFPQINTGTTTTADEEKYAKWINNYIADPKSNFEQMRMHGHSHVYMSVFSSGVDDAYQKSLIENAEDGDYYIFFILNKKHDLCILLYDFAQQVLFKTNDITIEIVSSNKEFLGAWAKEMINTHCSTPSYPSSGFISRDPVNLDNAKKKGFRRR